MSELNDNFSQQNTDREKLFRVLSVIFRDFLGVRDYFREQFLGPDAVALDALRKAYSQKKWDAFARACLCDCCLAAFILLHKAIAAVVLLPFRAIGYVLGFIPWGFRFAIGFLVAAIVLLFFCWNGSSVFLLNNYGSLEAFPDRNKNKISIVESNDYGHILTAELLDLTEEQTKLIEDLLKLQREAEVGKEPSNEQLALVSKITGVPMSALEKSVSLTAQKDEAKLHVMLTTEKLDGTRTDHTVDADNPTDGQLEAHAFFGKNAGQRFMSNQIPELEKLLPGADGQKGLKFKEVVSVKSEFTPARTLIRVNVPPMENDQIEEIGEQFDENNTAHIPAWKQYACFRDAKTETIIDCEIEAINKKNKELADKQDEKQKAELREKAESAIRAAQASYGRKLKPKEIKNIRDKFDAEFKPAPVLKVERATLLAKSDTKTSQIENLYDVRLKEHKFAKENMRYNPGLMEIIHEHQLTRSLDSYLGKVGCGMIVLLLVGVCIASLSSFLKPMRRWLYCGILAIGVLFALYWMYVIALIFDLPDGIMAVVQKKEIFSSEMRNDIWIDYFWTWLPLAFLSFFLWFPLLTFSAKRYFNLPEKKHDAIGDIAENMQCKGKASGLYRSTYWVLGYYFFFLLVLPVLAAWLNSCTGDDEYNIPKGDGGGQVAQVQVQKKVKKKKPKKRMVLNPNSAFIFAMPDIPDDELSQELDDQTSQEYQANGGGTFGPGKKKGGKPGWPNGMENGMIRFIRLKYSGGDWDQDMGKGADYNMLLKIKEYAGFKIANDTEAFTIDEIQTRFHKKGKKPPFLYITGRGGINMTTKEVKQLRKYLLEDGGLLFADNGGGSFNGSIRNLLKRALPNHELVDIANDDMIYQQPFYFPNGAPRLWHHSGDRALGIKNNGRWIVFYHQGDINDAWKTGGSGCSPQQQDQAYKMGANVICYAFGEYLRAVYGDAQQ